MRIIKTLIVSILFSLIFTILIAYSAMGLKIGDTLGNVLNTDIKVYINDVQITGYNIDGWTYVIAEKLPNYGFKVVWDGDNRSLSITKGSVIVDFKYAPDYDSDIERDVKAIAAMLGQGIHVISSDNIYKVGSVAFPYVYTDVTTYINGELVTSYNIKGYTVIKIDDLANSFGKTFWNGTERKLNFYYGGTISTNINNQNYSVYAKPVNSYLFKNNDNSYTRVEFINNEKIIVEQFDDKLNFISTSEIPTELTSFGGFYYGRDYNFMVFGQNNPYENNALEVFRVVKYDKNWERIESVGLANCNTTIPFHAGSLRMAEHEDMLYIRSSHQMYQSLKDGLNHQANITFSVSIPNMSIIDNHSSVSNHRTGYVSHSFNQFILTNGTTLAAVDHSDGYPRRAIILNLCGLSGDGNLPNNVSIDLLELAGETGAGETNASIGGFEASSSSYLVAGNSIIQDSQYQNRNTRNIFVAVTPIANDLADYKIQSEVNPVYATQIKWLTDYSENGQAITSTPHLVKIDENKFVVIWQEDNNVKYIAIDNNGNGTTNIMSMKGSLSDCKPIVVNGEIVWYVTKNSIPIFYTISLDELK